MHGLTHACAHAGYGITAVLENGHVLEKAAANVSVIRGTLSAARAQSMSARGRAGIDPKGGQPYAAAALSLVFHSAHPQIPTLRGDVRLFQVHLSMGSCLHISCGWGERDQLVEVERDTPGPILLMNTAGGGPGLDGRWCRPDTQLLV